jgi:lipopolysaccharide biosynthesis glycosyltransferase
MNFARNFADAYLLPLGVHRLVYLDADTIVQGDVADLWATELAEGQVAAFARSCTLTMRQIFDFEDPFGGRYSCRCRAATFVLRCAALQMASTHFGHPTDGRRPAGGAVAAVMRPSDCYINAGVYTVDLQAYAAHGIQRRVAALAAEHAAGRRLWVQGVQQSAFVLALVGRVAEVDGRWNTNSLGFNPNKAGRTPIR